MVALHSSCPRTPSRSLVIGSYAGRSQSHIGAPPTPFELRNSITYIGRPIVQRLSQPLQKDTHGKPGAPCVTAQARGRAGVAVARLPKEVIKEINTRKYING
ncbi:MAG: hypothetical protein M0Q43_00805 [Methanothrix sp.]|nr:hypothetical protein [Methanothrix sp.]